MRRHRPRIAHRPAPGFHQRDEPLDHFVEQRRLLEIEHVAGLREEREPRRRQMLLQEQARLDAIVVLVAADDQRRRRHFPDRLGHGVDRGTAALKAAHGVGRALGVVPRQRGIEIGVAARVLHQEGNPARRLARDLRDFDRADRLKLLGVGAALLAEGVEILEARSRSRPPASVIDSARSGALSADLQRRIGAHRQADEMRFRDLEMIEHGERVGVEMLVGVDLGRWRHVGGRVAARGIGDAAVAAREVAHLRLPIGVVGRELVQEDDRRSAARFFEIEADIIFGDGMGHLAGSFSLAGPRKLQLMLAAAMRRH